MAEAAITEMIIPGTYIQVRADALIGVGGISSGNIGIVGTATTPSTSTVLLSDYEGAKAVFGPYDAFTAGTANLTRALEILFRNGARTVYARGVAAGSDRAAFEAAFNELIKEDVQILIAPELSTASALAFLPGLLDSAESNGKDMMAVIGADGDDAEAIEDQVAANKRLIMTAPGIVALDVAATPPVEVELPGNYTAAAYAGLLSQLAVHISPTNKVMSGVSRLTQKFSYGDLKRLLNANVSPLEDRRGIRVVRGITTEGEAFKQITTRRITDYAKAGIRLAADPFIGRLNNVRVRKALQGAIDGFLTTMVQAEALTNYTLEVTATRDDEINGRAIVNAMIQPTFSIDYVVVTLVLQ